MAKTQILLTSKIVDRITGAYDTVTKDNVGRRMIHIVESVTNPFDVLNGAKEIVLEYGDTGAILQKKLITCKAISEEGYKANLHMLQDALDLEADEADPQEVSDAYQRFLNAARFQISVLSTEAPFANEYANGDEISVRVESYVSPKGDVFLRGNGKSIKAQAPVKGTAFGSIFKGIVMNDDAPTPEEKEAALEAEAEALRVKAKAATAPKKASTAKKP